MTSSALAPLMTDLDVERLSSLLSTRVAIAYREDAQRLRQLMRRAKVIGSRAAPPDLVTMNSTVVFTEGDAGPKELTVVYPWRANERGVVSVLSEIGTALLGLRTGEADDEIDLRIVALRYQPEAAGHWHL